MLTRGFPVTNFDDTGGYLQNSTETKSLGPFILKGNSSSLWYPRVCDDSMVIQLGDSWVFVEVAWDVIGFICKP